MLAELGNLVWTILSFVLALGIIVAVHEYGHYITGRLSGIKAEVFSLGFGPVMISRMDRHGTRWQLAVIPLGGFVRFKGDRDAASALAEDTNMPAHEARQTMVGAPLWARAATVAAGPIFNFVLAFALFAGLVLTSGLQADRAIVGQVYELPQAQPLAVGDEITAINGTPVASLQEFYTVAEALAPTERVSYTLLRDGQTREVTGAYPIPPRAAMVHLQNAAFRAGVVEGDFITAVNGQPIHAFSQLQEMVAASNGAAVDLSIWRAGEGTRNLTLTPLRRDLPIEAGGFETRWMIGISSSILFQPKFAAPP